MQRYTGTVPFKIAACQVQHKKHTPGVQAANSGLDSGKAPQCRDEVTQRRVYQQHKKTMPVSVHADAFARS